MMNRRSATGDSAPAAAMSFERSKILREKAHALIPGGCHTYAKGDDQYPELAPGFIVSGEGCHVWDADGNEYIEYGMGLRAVTLGHGCKPVVEAACRQMQQGINFTRPAPIEIECAEAILELIAGGEQVKFAKDGSTVTTAAVKLARACTGRDRVAICADHPFFSYNDWFIGSTAINAGVPASTQRLTVEFEYNNLKSLRTLFDQYPDQIACVIMEPARTEEPVDDFLLQVQRVCKEQGALFILDEMITGFRWDLGGAQKCYGVTPDLSAFGKALANGFAVSALVGKREIMERGGLHHDKERVFLLSTTHGAETHALAAAVATMRVYREEQVVPYLYQQGERLKQGVNAIIEEMHLQRYVGLFGRPCNLIYGTRDEAGEPSQPFRALFIQELIKGGVLAPSFVVSFAHTDADIDRTVEVVGEALHVYKKALDEGVEKYLVGNPVKPVYRKYN